MPPHVPDVPLRLAEEPDGSVLFRHRVHFAGQELENSRLPGAIRTQNGRMLIRLQQEREIVEDTSVPAVDLGVFDLEDAAVVWRGGHAARLQQCGVRHQASWGSGLTLATGFRRSWEADGFEEPAMRGVGVCTPAFCARWSRAWSIRTSAIIASAIGVARIPTQ